MAQSDSRATVYDVVTDRIRTLLEAGTVPWRRPWSASAGPVQAINVRGNAYRGVNRIMLPAMHYSSPVWLSFKQAQEHGGSVRKGERSTPIVFWLIGDKKTIEDGEDAGEHARSFVFRYYAGFNLEQTDGVTVPPATLEKLAAPRELPAIETAEHIVRGYRNAPRISHGGDRACYSPREDRVSVPDRGAFSGSEEYYSTLFHELGHSTGHESRLARDIANVFGDHLYSQEELVAELTASFLCAEAGIDQPVIANSAAYIASWLRSLENDHKLFALAAGRAQKAADHILGAAAA